MGAIEDIEIWLRAFTFGNVGGDALWVMHAL
jgi:hypothetical protein